MTGLSTAHVVIRAASCPLAVGFYVTVLCERVLMLCARALKLWEQGLAIKRSSEHRPEQRPTISRVNPQYAGIEGQ